VLPAHAGMVPGITIVPNVTLKCSPRTRGWSQEAERVQRTVLVLPAHAGIVRDQHPRASSL
jgi:hypothetical protein